LLVALVGVILAEKPVTSTKEVDDVVNVSVFTVCTTCNTVPALFVEINVPVFVGNVSVKLLFVLGAAMVSVPVPLAFPEIATCDIVFLYTTVHTEPVGTVTVIPEATDIGPALMAFLPALMVELTLISISFSV